MSHSYIAHAALGDPPRPAHQEILEEEQAQLDHVEDALLRCHYIVEIAREDIDRGIFPDGSDVRQVLDAIMMEPHGALLY